jgi:hypothetical protein
VPVQQVWSGVLLSGATANFSFTSTFTSTPDYTLCAFTKRSGDFYKFNDTTCVTIHALPAPYDAGVTALLSPGDTTNAYDSIQVQVRIRNFGTNTLTSIPAGYKKNGITVATETWTGSLLSGDSVNYTFHQKYISPLSNYSLCAFSSLPGDGYAANDEYCIYPVGHVGIEEYSGQDFYLWQNTPNPAGEMALINYKIPVKGKIQFAVHDIVGRVIFNQTDNANAGFNTIKFDVSGIREGLYFYSLVYKGKTITKKMVIGR